MMGEIPDGLERLLNLTHLDVSENRLEELPAAICQLVKLKTLDSNDNRLLTLPDAIGNLVAYASLPRPSCLPAPSLFPLDPHPVPSSLLPPRPFPRPSCLSAPSLFPLAPSSSFHTRINVSRMLHGQCGASQT